MKTKGNDYSGGIVIFINVVAAMCILYLLACIVEMGFGGSTLYEYSGFVALCGVVVSLVGSIIMMMIHQKKMGGM